MALHYDYKKVRERDPSAVTVVEPCHECGGKGERVEISRPEPGGGRQIDWISREQPVPEGWILSKIRPCHECKDEADPMRIAYQHPTLNSLIWATIGVDLPGIKDEAAAEEFQWRLVALAETGHPVITRYDPESKGHLPYIPSLSELNTYIGLTTNVSPMTRKQWLKKLGELVERDTSRKVATLRNQEKAEALVG